MKRRVKIRVCLKRDDFRAMLEIREEEEEERGVCGVEGEDGEVDLGFLVFSIVDAFWVKIGGL